MSGPVDVLAVIKRIAETNAAFATTADRDGIVRVGESMLSLQASDLRAVSAAVAELIEADCEFDAAFNAVRFDRTAESLDKLGTASDRRAAALANAGGAK